MYGMTGYIYTLHNYNAQNSSPFLGGYTEIEPVTSI